MNSVLTVRAHETGSHRNIGWETFTDAVIKKLSEERENLVFMLWGSYAKEKASLIDTDKHLILTAVHPSPDPPIMDFSVANISVKPIPFYEAEASKKLTGSIFICIQQHRTSALFLFSPYLCNIEIPIESWKEKRQRKKNIRSV